MFDLKKFLAENTITLSEDSKAKKLEQVFMHQKKRVRKEFEQYTQFPDAGSIRTVRIEMREFEAAAKALQKHMNSLPRRPKVPNPRNIY